MTCRDPTKRESVRVCRTGLEECQVFPAFFTGSLYDFFLKLHSQGTTPDDKIALICKVNWNIAYICDYDDVAVELCHIDGEYRQLRGRRGK